MTHWTLAEEERLRREYEHSNNGVLASSYRRSAATIYQKARALGLKKATTVIDKRKLKPSPKPAIKSPIDVFLYLTASPNPVEFS